VSPVVTRTLAADHVTPVRAYAALRSHAQDRSSFLLESVHPGERWGRYSIIGSSARTEARYGTGHEALAEITADIQGLTPPDPVSGTAFADTETLASLPAAELAAGFVEALKTGLLAGGALWERVRAVEAVDPAELDAAAGGVRPRMSAVISASASCPAPYRDSVRALEPMIE